MGCVTGSDRHDGSGDDFGCRIKYVRFDPAAMPSRRNTNPPTAFAPKNSWEAGIVRDHRGMPMLGSDLEPIGTKQYADNHHAFDSRRAALASGAPLSAIEGGNS